MDKEIKERIAAINSGIIPEGYKKTKVGIVPVGWEVIKLNDCCEFIRNGYTYQPVSPDNGVKITRIETISNRKISLDNVGYADKGIDEKYKLKKGDILFSHINSLEHIGKTAYFDLDEELYHGMNLLCIRNNDLVLSKFLFYWFNSDKANAIFKSYAKKAINQCSISTSELLKIELRLPPLPEQQKIAEILSTQDKLIELQEKKIEQLKELKKAYLQKMFPKKGSKYPELRFKGFTEPWEQRKLEEVITVGNGMDYKHLSEGDIPVYGTGGYMLNVDKALSYDKDAIGIGRKGTIDKPYVLKAPFWTVDTLFYCIPKEDYSLDFVYCIFQNVNWKEKDESTGVPSLSKVNINSTDVKVPTLAEQEKIGEYFSKLDSLITLHQRKSEQEKQKKKALMQLLLTGIVRTK